MGVAYSRQCECWLVAIVVSFGFLASACPSLARAQSQGIPSTEQYQELFASAGYSALFGAALGTAILPFLPSNSVSNLRVIAGGASLGFVAGSIMSLYSWRQQQFYGMQNFPDGATEPPSVNGGWQWGLGTNSGQDVFVRMDSRF